MNQPTTATKRPPTLPDENTEPTAMIRETQFEIVTISQRSQEEEASVTFDKPTFNISGTIRGRNGCYTARLNEVRVTDATLVVDIESYEDRADDEACTEANVYIEYRVTVTVDTDSPSKVTVVYNGEKITTIQSP